MNVSNDSWALTFCPICDDKPVESFNTRYVVASKCGKCGHIYATGVASDHGVQTFPDPDKMLAEYASRNLRLVRRWMADGFVAPDAHVLDIGAGTGHVLRVLNREVSTLKICAIEAEEEAARFLQSQGFTVLSDVDCAENGRFDGIVMIELLEHLADPVQFLRAVRPKLMRGGRVFATTPIGETLNGYRALSTYDTQEHVQFWTEHSFALACKKSGFAFQPIDPGIMYPQKSRLAALAKNSARFLRDALHGRRHLVGYLNPLS